MTVVTELDKTLFEGYIKAKSDAVISIIRRGILDDQMDWYETPQPNGMFPVSGCFNHLSSIATSRNPPLHV